MSFRSFDNVHRKCILLFIRWRPQQKFSHRQPSNVLHHTTQHKESEKERECDREKTMPISMCTTRRVHQKCVVFVYFHSNLSYSNFRSSNEFSFILYLIRSICSIRCGAINWNSHTHRESDRVLFNVHFENRICILYTHSQQR